MLSLRRLESPRATKSIGADFEAILVPKMVQNALNLGSKMRPLRLLGGLWAAKSIFERFLNDFGAHVEAMLEANIV